MEDSRQVVDNTTSISILPTKCYIIGVGEGGAGGAVSPPPPPPPTFDGSVLLHAVIVIECLFSSLLRKHQNASQTILFQNFSLGKIPSRVPYCGFTPPLLYYLLPLCIYLYISKVIIHMMFMCEFVF